MQTTHRAAGARPPSMSSTSTSGAGVQLKAALQGRSFDAQESMLAPRGSALQMKAVQRDDKQDAQDRETADGGHSLLRHGPEVSDAALERRLKTGMTANIADPSLETFSPAPGLATRFKTYALYNTTRQAAADECAAQLQISIDGTKDLCTNLDLAVKKQTDAKAALDLAKQGTDKVAIGKAGAEFGKAAGPVSLASNQLRTKVRTFDVATTPGLPLAISDSAPTAVERLSTQPGYKVVKTHGAAIGEGFRGVDKKVGNGLGKDGADADVFDDVSAKIDVSQTQTAMSGAPKSLAGINPKGETAGWKAGQHYPTDGEVAGISC